MCMVYDLSAPMQRWKMDTGEFPAADELAWHIQRNKKQPCLKHMSACTHMKAHTSSQWRLSLMLTDH